jgi:transcriptional regulator with XRE-family HTH domain
LPNNLLRILRRRIGLSQRELAFLLGYKSDSQVSRLENGGRMPHFVQVLAIELVFGVDSSEFFDDVRQSTRQAVCGRVRQLHATLQQSRSKSPRVSFKLARLQELVGLLEDQET